MSAGLTSPAVAAGAAPKWTPSTSPTRKPRASCPCRFSRTTTPTSSIPSTLPTPSENHAGLLELATTGEVDQGIIRAVAIDPVTLAHGFNQHRSNTTPASTGTAAIGTATRLARADHDHGDGYELAQADAEDRASTVFGQVSGERLAQATAVDEGVAFDVDDFPLRADIIGTRDRSRVHVVVPDDGSGNPDRNAVPVEIGHLQATDAHELTMTVGGHAGYRDPSLENFGGSYGSP